MINPGKPFNLYDYQEVILRRLWFFIVPLVVILIGTAVYGLVVPKEYQATTLILVTPQKVPESFIKPTVTSKIEDRLQSIGQEIMSRTRLEQIIKEFNLYQEEAKSLRLEEIVALMQKNIQVQIKGKEGGYFTIAYVGKDPKIVTLVTNKLASLFIEENLRLREQQAQGTSEFISIELSATKAKLEEQEKIIGSYKRKFTGELPEQRGANLQVLDRLQGQYQRIGDSLRTAQDRKLLLEKQLADLQVLMAAERKLSEAEEEPEDTSAAVPGVVKKEKKPTSLQARLTMMKNQLEDLRIKYTEKHPDLLILNKKIAEVEKEIADKKAAGEEDAEEETTAAAPGSQSAAVKKGKKKANAGKADFTLDPRYKEIQLRLLATDKEIQRAREEDAQIKAQMARYQERVEKTFEREQDMALLTRDYENTREAYASLLKKSQEAQQSENLERRQKGEQFKIIDPARIPEKPYKPDMAKIFLIGVVLGLAAAVGSAFIREQMDRSFRDAEDLQVTFGFKVLANIPRVDAKAS